MIQKHLLILKMAFFLILPLVVCQSVKGVNRHYNLKFVRQHDYSPKKCYPHKEILQLLKGIRLLYRFALNSALILSNFKAKRYKVIKNFLSESKKPTTINTILGYGIRFEPKDSRTENKLRRYVSQLEGALREDLS